MGNEPSKLTQIFRDREFSDITITVGPERKAFYLHRVVLAVNSGFFRETFKNGDTLETQPKVIHLPRVDPDAFDLISLWMYDGGLKFQQGYGDIVRYVYDGAGYLQMPQLQTEVIFQLCNFIRDKMKGLTRAQRQDLFRFFLKFCNGCSETYLEELTACTAAIIAGLDMKPQDILREVTDNSAGYLFTATAVNAAMGIRKSQVTSPSKSQAATKKASKGWLSSQSSGGGLFG